MPLNPQILIDGFRAISDSEYSSFGGFPQTVAESSQRYADVLGNYIAGMFPPTNGIPAAETAFITEHSQTTLQLQDGLIRFTIALTDFALVVNNALPFYNSIPPVGVVDLTDFNALGLSGQTAEYMATELATRIDTWIRTGVATPMGGGVPINWS